MINKLKPCPFCGQKAEVIQSEPSRAAFNEGAVHFGVACFNSDCQVMPYPKLWQVNEEEAMMAWNSRKEQYK
ncbi:Lar family restriction alleviation protein [Alteromonas sp.]|uniref:Lar family restriction alleviation protein n=1 Tax=Alteromonas sp. TaxID=232 RepID=UPI00257A30AC|nr:Lar family restriction alleviation protein [Alteromonas sp.]NQY17733.1 Lar family restriction alleviation protein [Alteromonas sp.]